MKYYVLSHEYTVADLHDFPRFIGAFSTKALVESALAEYRALPGFCEWPDGFHMDCRMVDNPSWSEGFSYPHPTGQIRASQSPRISTFVAAPGEGEVGRSSPLTHPAPSSVYCLRHEYTDHTHVGVFFIGLCSSREKAEETRPAISIPPWISSLASRVHHRRMASRQALLERWLSAPW